ncbi:hypothetical protein B9C88_02080 [Brevibacillus laterosporus]|nr:hypothetical protein B9C88_02080 [Brevibacillus laterosporus]
MPMGRTGTVGLRLFLRWLRDCVTLFTLYSAKTRLGGAKMLFLVMHISNPLVISRGFFIL